MVVTWLCFTGSLKLKFFFYLQYLYNAWKLQKCTCFWGKNKNKIQNLFVNTALLQFEQPLVSILWLNMTTTHKISKCFLCFTIAYVHHKKNEARLLLTEVECTRLPHEFPNDLKLNILGKSQNWGLTYSSSQRLASRNKNLAIAQENWTKSTIKLSIKLQLYLIL